MFERCDFIQATAAQVFVKNNKQWFAPAPVTSQEIADFRTLQKKSGIQIYGHTGYLINLGATDPENLKKAAKEILEIASVA